jgi:hypothetical protein
MGFDIPGLDEIRFHLAPTGTGDVHIHAEPVANIENTATTTLPPAVHLYPLAPLPDARSVRTAVAAEHLRAVDDEFFARLVAAAAARVAQGQEYRAIPELVHEPSAPYTVVVPTLPPLDPSIVADEWGVGGGGGGGGGGGDRGGGGGRQLSSLLPAVGWKEVALEDAGTSGTSSSLARRPGRVGTFHRVITVRQNTS